MKKTPEGLPQMAHFRASVVETPHLALLFKIYEKNGKNVSSAPVYCFGRGPMWKYELRIPKDEFNSSARLRLAGEAEFISRLVFRA